MSDSQRYDDWVKVQHRAATGANVRLREHNRELQARVEVLEARIRELESQTSRP